MFLNCGHAWILWNSEQYSSQTQTVEENWNLLSCFSLCVSMDWTWEYSLTIPSSRALFVESKNFTRSFHFRSSVPRSVHCPCFFDAWFIFSVIQKINKESHRSVGSLNSSSVRKCSFVVFKTLRNPNWDSDFMLAWFQIIFKCICTLQRSPLFFPHKRVEAIS